MKLCERKKRKSGSALLVVLGFLSFMVISAVAFAIYMRTERVPSSALRRNTATRHLVKAALAHAMSRVDDAIRNDPFPGLVNTNGNDIQKFYHDKDGNSMDLWLGRVFMPPNPEGLWDDNDSPVGMANEPGDGNKFPWRFAPVTETVSVLNLEALGYLPPPLVNDVRFLSRSSWAAKWQNFPFDAGRFAFCAVNVSDYFDINRTKVGVRSSPLDSCVSLLGPLSLSRTKSHAQDQAGKPEDSFALKQPSGEDIAALTKLLGPTDSRPTKNSNADPTTEYVSMLDYNLAFGTEKGKDGIGNVCNSPFYKYLGGKGGNYFYYSTTFNPSGNDGLNKAMRQPFVTDSFSPASNTVADVIDYAKLDGHPFKDVDMSNGKNLILRDMVLKNSDKFLKRMYDNGLIGPWDVPVLYDYLDHDNVPLSLAIPSVECVPMVTAVELMNGANIAKVKVNPPINPPSPVITPSPTTPGPAVRTTSTEYTLDPSSFPNGGWGVRVLVAFPFRHFSGRNPKNLNNFKVQVAMKVFVSSGDVSVRPTAADLAGLRPKNKTEWNQKSKAFTVDGNAPGDALVWSLYSDKVDVKIPDACEKQEDAFNTSGKGNLYIDVTSWTWDGDPVPSGQTFFTQILEEQGTVGPAPSYTFMPSGKQTRKYTFNLRPFDKSGKLLNKDDADDPNGVQPSYFSDQFRTYAMLWVRITDPSGKETYDLAPAVVADDELNGKTTGTGPDQHTAAYSALGFGPEVSSACLLFRGEPTTHFYTYANLSANNLTDPGLSGTDPNWQEKSLATVDPRYNYAPEDWFVWNATQIDGAKWLSEIAKATEGYFDVNKDRDPDIFMFTSDQGYLQSLGEFAFLPRLSQWKNQPGSPCSQLLKPALGSSATASYASSPNDILNNVCAWRTYRADNNFYEDCASIGIVRDSSKIQTVNPYSDDKAVLMAAFANTPCDYWTTGRIVAGASSRGETLDPDFQKIVDQLGDKKTSGDPIGELDECLQFSFCEKNDDAKMKDADMVKSMLEFSKSFRDAAYSVDDGNFTPWEVIYDDLFEAQLASLNGAGDYTKTDANAETFMGATLNNCPLYSIDRKFLYSYWRECFANKQQLFLIFVRAESTALGGPGEGTPSQQGGRAVALVWREPTACDENNHGDTLSDNQLKNASVDDRTLYNPKRRPHRMRVLFYHQFD